MRYTVIANETIAGLRCVYCEDEAGMWHHIVLEHCVDAPLEKGTVFYVDKLVHWIELPVGFRLNTEED